MNVNKVQSKTNFKRSAGLKIKTYIIYKCLIKVLDSVI